MPVVGETRSPSGASVAVGKPPRAGGVGKGVYRARRPRESPLWRLFDARYEDFEAAYEERFEETYGPLRSVVGRVAKGFLKCGILDFGFARIRCPDCGDEYLLAFSCKGRCLCPSCHKKRQVQFGEFATEEVLAEVPHRHVVFSVPRRLRVYFRRDRRRLAKLATAAFATVREFLQSAVDDRTAVPGAMACVQSYGELLDWHPHVHCLVSWGCFKKDGTFVEVKQVPQAEELEKLFRHKVLRMLLDEEAIDERVVKNLLSWHHTGFSAFVGHELPAKDREAREAVARYLVHPPVVVGRIVTEAKAEQVIYKGKKVHPRHGANFRIFDPLAFIAEVVSHIPNVHEKTAIHYGFYSNKTRGTRKAKGEAAASADASAAAEVSPGASAEGEGSPTEADRAPVEIRRNWSRLIKKVYEVDPLVCPQCGSLMKVVALIEKPEVVKRILDHLKLSSCEPPGRSPPSPITSKETTYEPLFDDLPWEEPTFEDPPLPEDDDPGVAPDVPLDDEPMADGA
jgi:transposase-like protein